MPSGGVLSDPVPTSRAFGAIAPVKVIFNLEVVFAAVTTFDALSISAIIGFTDISERSPWPILSSMEVFSVGLVIGEGAGVPPPL